MQVRVAALMRPDFVLMVAKRSPGSGLHESSSGKLQKSGTCSIPPVAVLQNLQ
jgi:hypothetical protein